MSRSNKDPLFCGDAKAAWCTVSGAYALEDDFPRLAPLFDYYRERLNVLAREYLFA